MFSSLRRTCWPHTVDSSLLGMSGDTVWSGGDLVELTAFIMMKEKQTSLKMVCNTVNTFDESSELRKMLKLEFHEVVKVKLEINYTQQLFSFLNQMFTTHLDVNYENISRRQKHPFLPPTRNGSLGITH